MTRRLLMPLALVCWMASGHAQQPAPPSMGQGHVMTAADAITWGPAPPKLPPGIEVAVLDGDPAAEGPFVLRVRFPDGMKVAPHWHPTDERLTVMSGTFKLGMGKVADASSMTALGPGSYARMPKEMPHYAEASGATVVQVNGMGPFVLNYVNPADDPTMNATMSKPRK